MAKHKGKDIQVLSVEPDTYEPKAMIKQKDGGVTTIPKKEIVYEHVQQLSIHKPAVAVKDTYHPKYDDKRTDIKK
jgi:hypothetical protein